MFVIFKEKGKMCVRPAYIGFIKNNIARRTLMVLFIIPTVIATVTLNLLQASICCVIMFIRAVIHPALGLIKTPVWKYHTWGNPRKRK